MSSYHNCFILLIRAICLILQLSASEQFESRILAVSMRYGRLGTIDFIQVFVIQNIIIMML